MLVVYGKLLLLGLVASEGILRVHVDPFKGPERRQHLAVVHASEDWHKFVLFKDTGD